MEKYQQIIFSLTSFTIVSILFLVILNITLKIIIKKFDIEKIRIYGMFLNMRKNTIISFSLTTLTYLLFVWLLIDLNINYIYIASIITISCIIAISFICYLNNLIMQDSNTIILIVKWLVTLFLFLYFTYITLINLNRLLEIEKIRVIKDKG